MLVAHIAREHSTTVCREPFQTAPDKGYSEVFGQYYIGYKLHLVVSLDGIYQSMDLTKASVHDVHYLKDIKQSGLRDCLLLADKGYLSARQQIDLFYSCKPRCGAINRATGRGRWFSKKPAVG